MIALISLIISFDYTDFLNSCSSRHCEVRSNRELYRADLHSASASVRLLRTSQ